MSNCQSNKVKPDWVCRLKIVEHANQSLTSFSLLNFLSLRRDRADDDLFGKNFPIQFHPGNTMVYAQDDLETTPLLPDGDEEETSSNLVELAGPGTH